MNKHVLFSVCDQPLSKYLGPSWSGFTALFCPCKQPKFRQPLHLTGTCRYDIGVLLKAPISLPSAGICHVTPITLGNRRHMAVPKPGCRKLSALQLIPSWKYTPGSEHGRARSFKPCSWRDNRHVFLQMCASSTHLLIRKHLGSTFESQMKRSFHCRWIHPKYFRQCSVHLFL